MDSQYVNEEISNVLILTDTHMCDHKFTCQRKTRKQLTKQIIMLLEKFYWQKKNKKE